MSGNYVESVKDKMNDLRYNMGLLIAMVLFFLGGSIYFAVKVEKYYRKDKEDLNRKVDLDWHIAFLCIFGVPLILSIAGLALNLKKQWKLIK